MTLYLSHICFMLQVINTLQLLLQASHCYVCRKTDLPDEVTNNRKWTPKLFIKTQMYYNQKKRKLQKIPFIISNLSSTSASFWFQSISCTNSCCCLIIEDMNQHKNSRADLRSLCQRIKFPKLTSVASGKFVSRCYFFINNNKSVTLQCLASVVLITNVGWGCWRRSNLSLIF